MTRKEFIKAYGLVKEHKIGFMDGRRYVERMMYKGNNGSHYVLYDNDLCHIKAWTDMGGREHYRIDGCYSWYH